LIFFFVEKSLGEMIFGTVWTDSSLLAYQLLLTTVVAGLATSSISLLRGVAAVSLLLGVRTITTLLFITIQTAGFYFYGLMGLGWASIISAALGICIWVIAKNRKIRELNAST